MIRASSFRTDSSVVSTFFLPVVERERAEAGQQRGKFSDLPHHPVPARVVAAIDMLRHLHAVGAKFRICGLPVSLRAADAVPTVVDVRDYHQRRIRAADPFAGGVRHPCCADPVAIAFDRFHVIQQLRAGKPSRAGQKLFSSDFVVGVHG